MFCVTYTTLLSQTEANPEDMLTSLHDSQRLDSCIDGLLKPEKKNVKFQLINIWHVFKIMHMGKWKWFLNCERETLTKNKKVCTYIFNFITKIPAMQLKWFVISHGEQRALSQLYVFILALTLLLTGPSVSSFNSSN